MAALSRPGAFLKCQINYQGLNQGNADGEEGEGQAWKRREGPGRGRERDKPSAFGPFRCPSGELAGGFARAAGRLAAGQLAQLCLGCPGWPGAGRTGGFAAAFRKGIRTAEPTNQGGRAKGELLSRGAGDEGTGLGTTEEIQNGVCVVLCCVCVGARLLLGPALGLARPRGSPISCLLLPSSSPPPPSTAPLSEALTDAARQPAPAGGLPGEALTCPGQGCARATLFFSRDTTWHRRSRRSPSGGLGRLGTASTCQLLEGRARGACDPSAAGL